MQRDTGECTSGGASQVWEAGTCLHWSPSCQSSLFGAPQCAFVVVFYVLHVPWCVKGWEPCGTSLLSHCAEKDGLREIRRLLKITELAGDRSHDSTLHFWFQHSMCSFSHTMPPLSYALPSWSISKSDRGDQINLHKLYARCKYSLKASIAQWLKTKTLGWWRPGAGTGAG